MPQMPSSLYIALPVQDAPNGTYIVGTLADASVVLHAEPGRPVPPDALLVIRDGSTPWTWADVAAEYPELLPLATPHEWAGEPTATPEAVEQFDAAKGLDLL